MYNKRIYLHQRHATYSTIPHDEYTLSLSLSHAHAISHISNNKQHWKSITDLPFNHAPSSASSSSASNPMCVWWFCSSRMLVYRLVLYKIVISSGNTFIYQFQITVTSMRSQCCCVYAVVWHIHTYTNTNLNAEAFITTLMPYSNIILSRMPILRTDLFTAALHT